MTMSMLRHIPRFLRRRRRGAVMVEYAFLLVAVGIPTVAGLTAGGKTMYDNYKVARNAMLSPFP
jgi:Flp pilus assembly pilin Flp